MRNPWIDQKIVQIEQDVAEIQVDPDAYAGQVSGARTTVTEEVAFQERRLAVLTWALTVDRAAIQKRLYEVAAEIPAFSLVHLRSDMQSVRLEDYEPMCMIELLEDALQYHEDGV